MTQKDLIIEKYKKLSEYQQRLIQAYKVSKWGLVDDLTIDVSDAYSEITEALKSQPESLKETAECTNGIHIGGCKHYPESHEEGEKVKSAIDNELINKLISEIPINRPNLAHIIQHGEINGTLLAGIRHAMQRFAKEYASQFQHSGNEVKPSDDIENALSLIAEWKLPESGQFWDKEQKDQMSYGAAYGSNGERDYFKKIAKDALVQLQSLQSKDKK